MFQKALTRVLSVALICTLSIHIISFTSMQVDWPNWLFLTLQLVCLGGFAASMISMQRRGLRSQHIREINRRVARTLGIVACYSSVVFFMNMGSLGDYEVRDGAHVKTYRGAEVTRFESQTEAERVRLRGLKREARGSSALWLVFTLAGLMFQRASASVEEEEQVQQLERSTSPSSPEELYDRIMRLESIVVPEAERLSLRERLNYTPWKKIMWGTGVQVLAFALAALYWRQPLLLFAACFLSFGFVNHFFYRRMMRYFLTGLHLRQDAQGLVCIFEYLDRDTPKSVAFPLAELRLTLNPNPRGYPHPNQWRAAQLHTHHIAMQIDVGFWDYHRLDALCAALTRLQSTSAQR